MTNLRKLSVMNPGLPHSRPLLSGETAEIDAFSGPVTSTAEHGVGAIGSGTQTAPITKRWTESGVIITQITFDITGFGVLGTAADEVIALVAGGAGYIGRNVVATNGVIFRAELACIEAPGEGTATITSDIDIATAASAVLEKDGDATTARLINAGTAAVGTVVVNDAPAVTADHYYYVAAADTAATTGVYNAGQYILTTYGHALLT